MSRFSVKLYLSIFILNYYSYGTKPRFCGPKEFKHGSWIRNSVNCGLSEYYSLPSIEYRQIYYKYHHLNLTTDHKYRKQLDAVTDPIIPEYSKFCWKPKKCDAVPFSRKLFCQVLNGRSLAFVGDSLTFSMYKALVGQLDEPFMLHEYNTRNRGLQICGNMSSSRLGYFRQDHLLVKEVHKQGDGRAWAHAINLFEIWVINKGAHVMFNKTYITWEHFGADTNNTARFLKTLPANKTIIFRTTPEGHPNCSPQSVAISDVVTDETDGETFNPVNSSTSWYGWDTFPARDAAVLAEFKRAFPSLIVLDVVPMTRLRPDGHASSHDCLHYHLPSVPDYWVYMLFDTLGYLFYHNDRNNLST